MLYDCHLVFRAGFAKRLCHKVFRAGLINDCIIWYLGQDVLNDCDIWCLFITNLNAFRQDVLYDFHLVFRAGCAKRLCYLVFRAGGA